MEINDQPTESYSTRHGVYTEDYMKRGSLVEESSVFDNSDKYCLSVDYSDPNHLRSSQAYLNKHEAPSVDVLGSLKFTLDSTVLDDQCQSHVGISS